MRKFMIISLCLATLWVLASKSQTDAVPKPCQFVAQALSDHQRIILGTKRAELESYFTLDGGVQFPGQSRYVYSKCPYLHVDVEFNLSKPNVVAPSRDDRITKISKLYVEYPAAD